MLTVGIYPAQILQLLIINFLRQMLMIFPLKLVLVMEHLELKMEAQQLVNLQMAQ